MVLRSPRDLGALIRDRRCRMNLDQRTLAERVGVSRQWIIEIEHGKPRAEVGLVLKTLGALGLRLSVDDGVPVTPGPAVSVPDIDAVVERARKRRP